jgi:hypothetical protein
MCAAQVLGSDRERTSELERDQVLVLAPAAGLVLVPAWAAGLARV